MAERRPPRHLGPAGKTLWRAVTAEYELFPHQFVALELAADAYDRCVQAREALRGDGLLVEDRFGKATKPHPAIAVERDSRIAVMRALRELDLEIDDLPAASTSPRPKIWVVS